MAGPFAKKASTPSKGSSSAAKSSSAKGSAKGNKSILNFFQKADGPPSATSRQPRITQFVGSAESPSFGRNAPKLRHGDSSKSDASDGLFLEDKKGLAKVERTIVTVDSTEQARSPALEDDIWGEIEDFTDSADPRYNENGQSVKRRKVDSTDASRGAEQPADKPKPSKSESARKSTSGPFIDESDSEEDMDACREMNELSPTSANETNDNDESSLFKNELRTKSLSVELPLPPPVRDATDDTNGDEFANFDDPEDGDEFLGEEFRETPWDAEEDTEGQGDDSGMITPSNANDATCFEPENERVSTCPICQKALMGFNETELSVHVNDCLDGKTSIAPATATTNLPDIVRELDMNKDPESGKPLTRFDRAAVARPAQRDPFSKNAPGARSAFTKMMAGNAEDSAWAEAAANEISSRGKQAYQRTCPFYKIMPGFSICVDAFRYGAVEGCNAYFLSHFHSDHYIGLTKSWCHGPIYCSRPTGNLVRQQLRVDPKWVVDLDFETTTEVPNTGGVQVTMIPANHCPGSSLFLFEKSFGHGPNARRQRILHCGDFRASPAHLQHPLLRPDPINSITGQPRQQRIDTCYLDTTYLNPKYAFPSQEDVITACAELCVRLNEESGVGGDLGVMGGGGLMSKFLSAITKRDSAQERPASNAGRLLVVIGTYSIGKERICLGIAKALGSKIFANPQKQRICACLEDPELSGLLTSDPREAQVHMQTLFEIRADTLADYLDTLKPHFSRVVGFRPTGWSYRPPAGRMLDNPPVPTVLRGEHWKTPFTAQHLTPQRGSTRESACFGVPYSEHSSFRELTMFCCALRIGRVIPTVNVGSQRSRDKMKAWIERWEGEKKRNGLFPVADW